VCWNITEINVCLLCNVHFVQSKQSIRLQTGPFVRGINYLLKLKNIDVPVLTCVCGKNFNIVSMCAVSLVVHTSNISNCQNNFFSFPVAVNNSIKVGPLVFLL
jgi:hypothetical protein